MNNMHDVVIVLTEYELYSIIDACCATLAPQFSTLHQCNPTYPNCNFQLATPTWEATRNSIKWSERTRRTFNITRLKGSLPISDWVPFFANYIIHIASHEVTRKVVCKHGTYDPQPNKNNKYPLDNINMITSTKVKHQVNRIENLRVNASSVPPTYNTIQLSGALFTSL